MLSKKLMGYNLFLWTCLFMQAARGMNQTPREHLQEILHDQNQQTQASQFDAFLTAHPEYISTILSEGINFHNDQTLAHFLANTARHHLLKIMFDHGETGTTQIQATSHDHDHDKFCRCIGSTAFLTLCFNINTCFTENTKHSKNFLKLLDNFLTRTPNLAIIARRDGMTPAMAVASSNSLNKLRALSILIKHHLGAFEGTTNEEESIADLLIKTKQTSQSLDSCRLLLSTLCAKNNITTTQKLNALIKLQQNCTIFSKHQYLNIIDERIIEINRPPQIKPLQLPIPAQNIVVMSTIALPMYLASTGFDREGRCLCCAHQCYCCIKPQNTLHHAFWQDWYSKHPDHPNAVQWHNTTLPQSLCAIRSIDTQDIW